jgi:hypothetical protein
MREPEERLTPAGLLQTVGTALARAKAGRIRDGEAELTAALRAAREAEARDKYGDASYFASAYLKLLNLYQQRFGAKLIE